MQNAVDALETESEALYLLKQIITPRKLLQLIAVNLTKKSRIPREAKPVIQKMAKIAYQKDLDADLDILCLKLKEFLPFSTAAIKVSLFANK